MRLPCRMTGLGRFFSRLNDARRGERAARSVEFARVCESSRERFDRRTRRCESRSALAPISWPRDAHAFPSARRGAACAALGRSNCSQTERRLMPVRHARRRNLWSPGPHVREATSVPSFGTETRAGEPLPCWRRFVQAGLHLDSFPCTAAVQRPRKRTGDRPIPGRAVLGEDRKTVWFRSSFGVVDAPDREVGDEPMLTSQLACSGSARLSALTNRHRPMSA